MASPWLFRTDGYLAPLYDELERRGWAEESAGDEDDCEPLHNNGRWRLWWASVQSVRAAFMTGDHMIRLQPWQLVNHFPNHYELTRKDLMAKHIQRYCRPAAPRSGGSPVAAADRLSNNGEPLTAFVPATFALPSDHSLFVEATRRTPSAKWIVKPANRSQGRGIFIVSRATQLAPWLRERPTGGSAGIPAHVVSLYVDRPLLIGGKKFDLRIYVLVTSFAPLRALRHRLGFARFCTVPYAPFADQGDDLMGHLTNVALQKHGDQYNTQHGGKWPIENLMLRLRASHGTAAVAALEADIAFVIVQSLLAAKPAMLSDRHCFELYGYDLLLDEQLRPWLIEVNASPSLTPTTTADGLMKASVLGDLLDVVAPDVPAELLHDARPRPLEPHALGGFSVLIDETR
jgi:tubulin polyglutamylase TTLL1